MSVYKQIIGALNLGLFEKAFLILRKNDRYLSKTEVVRLYTSQNIDPDMTKFLLRQSIHRYWAQQVTTTNMLNDRIHTFETYRNKFVELEYVNELLESGQIDEPPPVIENDRITNDPRILRFFMNIGELNRMIDRGEIMVHEIHHWAGIGLREIRQLILNGHLNWEPYGRRIIDIIGLTSNKITSIAFPHRAPIAKYQIKRGVDLPISAMQGTRMSAMTLSEYRMHLTYFPDDPERDRYILSNTGDEDWHVRLRRLRGESAERQRRFKQEKIEIQKEESEKKREQDIEC